jgi:hypothetical protein
MENNTPEQKPLTLQELKDEVAKKHGYANHKQCDFDRPLIDDLLELYASQQNEALQAENKWQSDELDIYSRKITELESEKEALQKRVREQSDVLELYGNLLVATQKYIDSITGRDMTFDKFAFNEADKIANKLADKLEAINP